MTYFGRRFGRYFGRPRPSSGGGDPPPPPPPDPEVLTELVYHVAIGGNDSNPGTLSQPFASIEAARDAIRAATGRTYTAGPPPSGWEGANIVLHSGVHFRSSQVVFDGRDSGTEEYPLYVRAADGETVEVSGGILLDGLWEEVTNTTDNWAYPRLPVAGRGKVYRVNIGSIGWNKGSIAPTLSGLSEQLRVVHGGVLRPMSRYPNGDYSVAGGWLQMPSATYNGFGQPATLNVPDQVPASFDYVNQNLFAAGVMDGQDWWYHHIWESLSGGSGSPGWTALSISSAQNNHTIVGNAYSHIAIRNGIEFIAPGTFVWRHTAGILYYWAPDGLVPTGARITYVQDLFRLASWDNTWNGAAWTPSNSFTAGSEVNYLTFVGLTLGDARGRVVYGGNNKNIRFYNCHVRNAGLCLIDLVDSTGFVFDGGSLHHSAHWGLRVHGRSVVNGILSNTVVKNCSVYEVTFDPNSRIIPALLFEKQMLLPYQGSGAGISEVSNGVTVQNVQFSRLADSGISLCQNLTIEDCTFADSGTLLSDNGIVGGAGSGARTGFRIRRCTFERCDRNPLSHPAVPTMPLYIDFIHDVVVEDCTFRDCPTVSMVTGKFLVFRRNVFERCGNNHYLAPKVGTSRAGSAGTWYEWTATELPSLNRSVAPWNSTFAYLWDYAPGGSRYADRMKNEGIVIVDNVQRDGSAMLRWPQSDGYWPSALGALNYPLGSSATPIDGGGTVPLSEMDRPD